MERLTGEDAGTVEEGRRSSSSAAMTFRRIGKRLIGQWLNTQQRHFTPPLNDDPDDNPATRMR
ncbi:hypothetical protein Dda_3247 [Drechslerella dactyloides]|uniref:Uncharacterized protein n=1 Tax=Drechslerella dactyloides TaxID=74499 RepID=A0AAD6J0Z5_DREDA|nr:hypothetical protein Dda_3247 [Drechslerella dactyloides]